MTLDEGSDTSEGPVMSIEKLIQNNPQFHVYKGSLTSWAIHPDTLAFLYDLLEPGMSTLETGCGQTTVVFSAAGTKHICITPDSGEADRVKQFCATLGLPQNISFLIESSDVALPCSELIPAVLDHVFVDGAHGFPAAIIDWHYTARRLRLGGVLGLDDFRMPSVRILYDFLCIEREWELIKIVRNTAFFRKIRELQGINNWHSNRINRWFQGDRLMPMSKRAKAVMNVTVMRMLKRLKLDRVRVKV
jgi:hypothetical protein